MVARRDSRVTSGRRSNTHGRWLPSHVRSPRAVSHRPASGPDGSSGARPRPSDGSRRALSGLSGASRTTRERPPGRSWRKFLGGFCETPDRVIRYRRQHRDRNVTSASRAGHFQAASRPPNVQRSRVTNSTTLRTPTFENIDSRWPCTRDVRACGDVAGRAAGDHLDADVALSRSQAVGTQLESEQVSGRSPPRP